MTCENSPFFYAINRGYDVQVRGMHKYQLGTKVEYAGQIRPDGIYAQWHWDGKALTVNNDRYGFYPLYYYCKGDEICLSPSIDAILSQGACAELDFRALSVFIRLGYFLSEDTPFKYIRSIPPDVFFKWSQSQLTLSSRLCLGKPVDISKANAIEKYIHLFRQSIKRRRPKSDDFIVPLSGGRDSRHILFELLEQGYRPKFCPTFEQIPPRNNEDARIAALLTRAAGVEGKIFKQKLSFFEAEKQKNIETNYCAEFHSQYLSISKNLPPKIDTSYDGISGDVLSDGYFMNHKRQEMMEQKQYRQFARDVLDSWGADPWEMILHEHLYKKVSTPMALDYLTSEIEKIASAPNPVGSFIFWHRSRREIALASYGIYKNIETIHCPFLDHDLYDFLVTLKADFVIDQQFHTQTILKAYPKFMHIPFEDKSASLVDATLVRKHFVLDLLKHIVPRYFIFHNTFNVWYILSKYLSLDINRFYKALKPNMILYFLTVIEKTGNKANVVEH